MNETECDNLIKSVKWAELSNVISLAILQFITILVIGGNLLVILAVFCSNKLRSVTNFFIVNLAVADLLVGLAVLPFSATWEVYKVWIFGDIWCRIWLAVDVWMCTASILNLCAISLDRYVAVTRPVTYPSIMSTKRAKCLIAIIWVLSFFICCPPLITWTSQEPTYNIENYTLYYATGMNTTTTTTDPSAIIKATPSSAAPPPPSLNGVATTFVAPPASLIRKGSRKQQKKPLGTTSVITTTTTTTATTTKTNTLYTTIPTPPPPPPLPAVSIAKTFRQTRTLSSKSTSSSSSSSASSASSSFYNSFNPYDPYYAHLQNHDAGGENVNNQLVVGDTDAAAPFLGSYNHTAHITNNNNNNNNNYNYDENDDADIDDNSSGIAINDDDNEYILTTRDSSENARSILYNNDPTSALYYDTADVGRATGDIVLETTTSSIGDISSMPPEIAAPKCPWKCELTNDRSYVLYSALGSFYIPMLVMLFFYWRIYRAAVRTTRAINQGFKTTKGSPHESGSNRVDETQLVLRIHRGRPCSTPQRTPLSVHSMSSTLSVNSNTEEMLSLQHHSNASTHHHLSAIPKRATSMKVPRTKHEKVSIKVSFPSSENMLDSTTSISSTPPAYSAVVGNTNESNGRRNSFKTGLFEIGETTFNVDSNNTPAKLNKTIESHTDSLLKRNDKKQRGKRSVKFQVKRFKVETKAAKTLAIIVGGFIFCWLPFFTMYLIRAFCDHCIQPTVFSVLFWLGYCNSAINPLIYALFSHEFRIAFKRIVCRCVCTRSGFRASENFHMIAARALMAPATFHKTISGCSDEGEGPEFS